MWCHSSGTQALLLPVQLWERERGPVPCSYLLGEALPQLLQGAQHLIDVKHTDHLDPLQSLQLQHKVASPTASPHQDMLYSFCPSCYQLFALIPWS